MTKFCKLKAINIKDISILHNILHLMPTDMLLQYFSLHVLERLIFIDEFIAPGILSSPYLKLLIFRNVVGKITFS